MELANAAGHPDRFAEFHVCPELAKYFAGRVGTQFLVRLKQAADADSSKRCVASAPNSSAIALVESAAVESRALSTNYRRGAALFVAATTLSFTFWYGPQALLFALPSIWVAFAIGENYDERAFSRSSLFLSAVDVIRTTLAFERETSTYWSNLHWRDLELEVSRLFQRMGYEAHATPGSNDKGVDVVAVGFGKKLVIQCKQYTKPGQRNLVSELLGVVQAEGANRGILICTGGFAPGAESYAATHGIELWDLAELAQRCKSLHA